MKDVIYHKRKKGQQILINDGKRCLLKKCNVTRLHELMGNDIKDFDQKWKTFQDKVLIIALETVAKLYNFDCIELFS